MTSHPLARAATLLLMAFSLSACFHSREYIETSWRFASEIEPYPVRSAYPARSATNAIASQVATEAKVIDYDAAGMFVLVTNRYRKAITLRSAYLLVPGWTHRLEPAGRTFSHRLEPGAVLPIVFGVNGCALAAELWLDIDYGENRGKMISPLRQFLQGDPPTSALRDYREDQDCASLTPQDIAPEEQQ